MPNERGELKNSYSKSNLQTLALALAYMEKKIQKRESDRLLNCSAGMPIQLQVVKDASRKSVAQFWFPRQPPDHKRLRQPGILPSGFPNVFQHWLNRKMVLEIGLIALLSLGWYFGYLVHLRKHHPEIQ